MTIVSQELARIAQTINRGVSGLGTSRLAGEQQKTRGALLDYNLGRNRVEDARAAERFAAEQPVREVAGLQAQTDLDREASYDSEVQDTFTAYMRTQWLPGVAEHYGTEIDISTGSPRLVFPDGSVLKEIQRDKKWEAAHILSKYKLSSTSKDQIARIEEKEQRLNAEGVPIADPAYGKLAGNKMKIQARLDNPEEMIQGLRNQIDQLERSGGHFPEAIKRIKGEIKEQKGAIAAQKKYALEERKVKVLEARERREKGKKAVKLHPSQVAKKDALLKRYGNNLAIQKQFKAGYDEFLGVQTSFKEKDYTDAVSDNEQIMRDLEALGIDEGSRNALLNEAIAIGKEMQTTVDEESADDEIPALKKSNLTAKEASQQKRYIELRQQGKSPEEAHKLSMRRAGAGGSY